MMDAKKGSRLVPHMPISAMALAVAELMQEGASREEATQVVLRDLVQAATVMLITMQKSHPNDVTFRN